MEEKKPFGARLEAFFAGKGFYAVLFLCVAVIGVSAWSMLSGGAERSAPDDASIAVANMDEPYTPAVRPAPPTVVPAATEPPAPAEEAPPVTAPAPVPAPAAVAEDYYIRPVNGEIDGAYAMTELVWNPTMRDWRTHDGVDLTAALGTQVKAAAAGEVTACYEDDLYGTTVEIRHGGGLQSVYSNLAATPTVSVGDRVTAGQVIGAVGDTALGESGQVCHLHFSMRKDGESVDPGSYLP